MLKSLEEKASQFDNQYYYHRVQYRQIKSKQKSFWDFFKFSQTPSIPDTVKKMTANFENALAHYQKLNKHWKVASLILSLYEIEELKKQAEKHEWRLIHAVRSLNFEDLNNLEEKLGSLLLSKYQNQLLVQAIKDRYLVLQLQDPMNKISHIKLRAFHQKIIELQRSNRDVSKNMKLLIQYEMSRPNPDIQYLIEKHRIYCKIDETQIILHLLKRDYESAKQLRLLARIDNFQDIDATQRLIKCLETKDIIGLENCKQFVKKNVLFSFLFYELVKSLKKELSQNSEHIIQRVD